MFQDVKVLVTRPQEDCCFLPDLNFHRGQTESPPSNYYMGGSTGSPPSTYYIGGSTESPPSKYHIGGSTCIMTSMYRVMRTSSEAN